jgi:hypothetical protein
MIVESFYQSLTDNNRTLVNFTARVNFMQMESNEALRLFDWLAIEKNGWTMIAVDEAVGVG